MRDITDDELKEERFVGQKDCSLVGHQTPALGKQPIEYEVVMIRQRAQILSNPIPGEPSCAAHISPHPRPPPRSD
jgi:hypothetical protein